MKSTIELCAISYHINFLQSHCRYSAAEDMDGRWIVPHLYNYSCAKSYKFHCFRLLGIVIGNPFGKVTNCRGDTGHVVNFSGTSTKRSNHSWISNFCAIIFKLMTVVLASSPICRHFPSLNGYCPCAIK
jgi:hypothetical protein